MFEFETIASEHRHDPTPEGPPKLGGSAHRPSSVGSSDRITTSGGRPAPSSVNVVNREIRRTTCSAREREIFAGARVARLATVRPDGRPHLVPITFASPEPGLIVTAVDHKPKRNTNLQRLRNVEAHPAVSLLLDHYDDDWAALWWLRIDATARVVYEDPERTVLTGALVRKYTHYLARPPTGPVIAMEIDTITSWNLD